MLCFSSSTSVNKHISGTGAFRLSVRSSVLLMCVHPALMHAKLLFNDKRSVQWTSDWCKSRRYFVQSWQKSNTCTQPRERAHSVLRVCDHWAFLVFLCHKCAQASFFFLNHWIRAWWNHIGWCLSQMLSAKAQGSLRFCAISSGNSKFWSGWRI